MKVHRRFPFFLSAFTLVGLIATKAHATLLIGNSASNSIIVFDESTGTVEGNFVTPGFG